MLEYPIIDLDSVSYVYGILYFGVAFLLFAISFQRLLLFAWLFDIKEK